MTMRVPTKENALVLTAVDTGGKNTRRGPDQSLSCPHSRSRDHPRVGGHPKEVWWTAAPSEGQDADSRDSRKHLLFIYYSFILTCSVAASGYFSFFPFLPSVVVVADFISTITSI